MKCIFWIFARDLAYITISMHYAHSSFNTLYDLHSSVEVSEDTIYILVPLIYIFDVRFSHLTQWVFTAILNYIQGVENVVERLD